MSQVNRDIPLFAAPALLDRAAVYGNDRIWTWRDVHMASYILAGRLVGKGAVLNVCRSYIAFVVTWLATIRCGALLVLPGSDNRTHLFDTSESAKPAVAVSDTPDDLRCWPSHCSRILWDVKEARYVSDAKLELPELWRCSRVCLYTSGSTGAPQPELKTINDLIAGAQVLGARMRHKLGGPLDQINCLVSSVVTRHMFGVESVLMLSLVHGIAVLDRRPLLPADVSDSFSSLSGGGAWITTPLHISALARAGYPVGSCKMVISATMPLDAVTAQRVEYLVQAPVVEVYGSTETGAIATRQTSCTDQWQLLDDVQITPDQSGLWVQSNHSQMPRRLNDIVQPVTDDSFRLVGRSDDLIKVAGHRASLSGLNLALQSVPGLEESVLYMPRSGSADQRPVLMYVGERLSFSNIKAVVDKKLIPVFVPRILIQVESLPRRDNGKLALRELDQIYQSWVSRQGDKKHLDVDTGSLVGA